MRHHIAKIAAAAFYFTVFLCSANAADTEDKDGASLVWQMGVEDNSADEFLPYSNREFKYNHAMAKQPGYDRKTKSFSYTIPQNGIIKKPLYPQGISGSGAGTITWVNHHTINWKEEDAGWRIIEIKLMPSKYRSKYFPSRYKIKPSSNMDIDGMDILRYTLRVSLPGKRVIHQFLPYDLGSLIKKKGPMIIKACFKVEPGNNKLEMLETSGHSYGRNYHFDYIRITKTAEAFSAPPTVEVKPGDGFRHYTIYEWKTLANLDISIYNLAPGQVCTLDVEFINYFGQLVGKKEIPVLADSEGACVKHVPCPMNVTGYIRAQAKLSFNGQYLPLQIGHKDTVLHMAAFRMIEPLNEKEKDASFLGFCGLCPSTLFDPYKFYDEYMQKMDDYRGFRRTLQVKHERFHSLMWPFLEPEEGKFQWKFWDKIVEQENKEGIRLQLAALATPFWMTFRHYPDREKLKVYQQKLYSVPADMKKWGKVCGMIAERYKDKITDFEVWNEPSEHSLFWYKGNAEEYFNLIKYASEAVRKAAPNVNIVAETVWTRQSDFSEKLYEMGVGKYIDYPADHYQRDERVRQINKFLDKVGRNKGLINNEAKNGKVGGFGETTEEKRKIAARTLLRNTLFKNANQVLRIYEFEILSKTWRKFGMTSPTREPRYTFCAYKTMFNRTSGANFYKTLELGDKLEGYVYKYFNQKRIEENGGDNALFLFNRSTKNLPIKLFVNRPYVTVVDLMDNSREVETENGLFAWELTQDPIIVIGADLKTLEMQDAIKISPATPDTTPGKDLKLAFSISEGAKGVSLADIELDTSSIPGADTSYTTATKVGTSGEITIPIRENIRENVYSLPVKASLTTTSGNSIPVFKQVPVVVSQKPLGLNLFAEDTFSKNIKEWNSWGAGKTTLKSNAFKGKTVAHRTATDDKATSAISSKNIAVIPGQRYYLMLRNRGDGGMLHIMMKKYFENGKDEIDHNFVNGKTTADWQVMSGEWVAPNGVKEISFSLYYYKEKGYFEATDLHFMRIDPERPVNRLLFTASAHQKKISLDGDLSDWDEKDFVPILSGTGIKMADYKGEEDISGKFAMAYNKDKIYIATIITDDKHVEGPQDSQMWKGDSIQFDFEPFNRNYRTETTQFCFSTLEGKARSYRHRLVPSEDIVTTYKVCADPAGVRQIVKREGNRTIYEIEVDVTAISPTFNIEPGSEIGFSMLANDNDGSGRKGWIEWSGGIGDIFGSTMFGTLKFE